MFALTAADLRVPGIPNGVLQQVISQATTANVWWPPLRLPAFFAAWRIEAPFFRGFPFRCVLHLALSLTRSIIVHVATPYSREDPLHECDNLSCLFFAAPWLQQSQSILVQEIQLAKDIDLTCFKTLPIKATTCLQVRPCPWIGQWIQLQDLINPARPPPMRIPTTNIKEALFQLPHTPV